MSDTINTKRMTVAHKVPRDPEEYRPTIHFAQRLGQRVPEHHQGDVIRELITSAECSGSSCPSGANPEGVDHYFTFRGEVCGREYCLVVGCRASVFKSEHPAEKHLAVTIYSPEDPEEGDGG
jgi:hypothetical protein